MQRIDSFIRAVLLAVVLGLPVTALATNGYFMHGVGTRAKGQAGAGSAAPQDAIEVATNPSAGLATSGQLDIGLAVFNPRRSYSASASLANGNGGAFTIGEGSLDSGREYFLVPHIAWSRRLSDDSAFSLAFYGRGGMNTRWSGGSASFDPDGPGPAPVGEFPGTFGAGRAGVNLSQAFIDVGYARRVSPALDVGGALVFGVQSFEATGVASFAGFTETFALSGGQTPPTALSDNGTDYSLGLGAKLGFRWDAASSLSVAGSYQSKIRMSEFDDYADLFAEQGNFDIPPSLVLGIAIRAGADVSLFADVERTWYSEVDSVGNSLARLFDCPTAGAGGSDTSACLGGRNGAGFGWQDMTTVKLGAEWRVNETWIVRGGFSDGDQPIPDSEVLFNILAPGVIEQHVTLGATRRSDTGLQWSVALMHALDHEISGVSPFDPTQTIALQMDQWEAEVSFSLKF